MKIERTVLEDLIENPKEYLNVRRIITRKELKGAIDWLQREFDDGFGLVEIPDDQVEKK